jgi:hypothetical protein
MGVFLSEIAAQVVVTSTSDISSLDAYCDIVTITMGVRNLEETTTNFTGEVVFNPFDIEFIDYSGLPSASIIEVAANEFHIVFDVGLINSDEWKYFVYSVKVKAPSSDVYKTDNIAYVDGNTSIIDTDEFYFNVAFRKPIYGIQYVSDIMADIEEDGFFTSLYPVEPLEGAPRFVACNPESTQGIYIAEELIFDVPEYCLYNFDTDGGIALGNGALIKVKAGSVLLIDHMVVRSCDQMWKGIYVESGGKLILNDCIIGNAQYGIQAERGAILSVRNTTFVNNFVGLYVSPFTYTGDPENPQGSYIMLEKFDGNTFIGIGAMLPGYTGQSPVPSTKPYAGIELNYLSSFTLPGNVESSSNGYANFFEDLSNGIIARHTSLYIGDAYFKDIESTFGIGYSPNGYGVFVQNGKHLNVDGTYGGSFGGYDYHFDNVANSVYAQGGSVLIRDIRMNNVGKGITIKNTKNRTFDILHNTISAVDKGIELLHNVPVRGDVIDNTIAINGDPKTAACIEIDDFGNECRWKIEENTLTINDGLYGIIHRNGSGISIKNNPSIEVIPVSSPHIATGIYLENSLFAEVFCNHLTTDEITSTYPDFTGIYGSGAEAFKIRCNAVTNFKYGLNFVGNNMQCFLQGNSIGKQWDGLLLGLHPDYGNSVVGTQNLSGNLWTGAEEDYQDYGAIHLGDQQTVRLSPFTYNTSENPLSKPPSIYASDLWFEGLKSGDLFECSGIFSCPEESGFIGATPVWDSLDLAVSNGDLGFEHFDPSLSWSGKLHTYRKLKNLSPTLLPQPIEDFLEEEEFLPIGLFSQAFDSLEAFLRYEGPQSGVLIEFPEFVSQRFNRIAILDSLLYLDPGNDSLLVLKYLVMDSILMKEINYLQKTNYIKGILENGLERLMDAIDEIDPDSVWEENLKFTLQETIELALYDTLTSSHDLYNLALSCPDYYGIGVYQARSLIRQDSAINFYDHLDLCEPLFLRSVKGSRDSHAFDLFIYPNPAYDVVHIVSPPGTNYISISDIFGRVFITQPASKVSQMDIDPLPSGLYWLNAYTFDGPVFSAKFVIVK